MKTRNRFRPLRLTLGTALVGVLALNGLAAPAFAAPGDFPGGNTEGSLTVHKFEEAGNTVAFSPDGVNNDLSGLTPLEGVEFTVRLVDGLDLTQSQSWDILKRLEFTSSSTATDPEATPPQPTTYALTQERVMVTDAAGVAPFSGLPAGAYLVEETGAPPHVTKRAEPFFISIPMPFENQWLSDVHVYPKNSVTEVNKEAGDPNGLGLGSLVPWSITVKVPTLAPGDTFSTFSITDALDTRLVYEPSAFDSFTVDGVEVAADLFTITPAGSNPVVLSLNDPAGLAWLNGQQGKTLSWTLTTKVISNEGDGSIENKALVNINDSEIETEIPGTSNWGAVQITKHVEGDLSQTLSGAVFEVYADATGGDPISVYLDATQPNVTQFTTDDNGRVVIPGLSVGPSGSKVFYLKEVVAPGGYALLTDRIAVTVTTGGVETPVEISIANSTDEGNLFPNLPLTGGSGTLLLILLGAGLLATATGAVIVRRKREHATT